MFVKKNRPYLGSFFHFDFDGFFFLFGQLGGDSNPQTKK
jgi:hypothetical protein